jgi:mono/diheme cytochrome c family protein
MLTHTVCIISFLLILPSGMTSAANPAVEHTTGAVASGFERFIDSCAFCHGVNAKGNGPAAELLSKLPADLTLLSKRNENIFPLEYVYNTIDGRAVGKSHGSREMPVWGDLWKKSVSPEHAESYVRARIFEIIMFLDSVQE